MDICAVIVTFNRLECLKKALKKYEEQTKRPKYLLVVNNNSSDGTMEYLKIWEQEQSEIQKVVVNLPCNTGGAGGFHAGMEKALELDCDWIWVSDDDAYPEPDALKSMEVFYDSHPSLQERIAAMCGTIMDYDKEKILLGHHCRNKKVMGVAVMKEVPEEEYNKEFFDLDLVSYVGTVFKVEAIKKAGTTREDFFIYSDDWEHSMRVRKYGRIICVPKSLVLHVGESTTVSKKKEAVWHDYYSTRNIIIALKEHFGLGAAGVRSICRMLTAVSTMNPRKIKIFSTAIRDAYRENTGIHPIYKPGWKEDK